MARSGSAHGGGTSVPFAMVRRIPATTWSLITQTVGVCLRYRVTGLAAEAAFFAILSLPPLIFGLAGSIGYIASRYFEVETIEDIKTQIAEIASQALTADSVRDVIVPTLDSVLDGGRPDVISIGFVLALWSGSRALNVFVDTITIMYGMGGRRGIVRTRALSFSLYCAALVIGVIVLPLVLAGPDAVDAVLPERVDFLNQLYWPVVTILSAGFLNTLYHLSVPVRTPWVSDLPGAFLALSLWILGSFVLRWVLQSTVGGTSIYGPLAAPIAVLLWLYLTAIAVLIGAALNAVVDRLWPHKARQEQLAQEKQAQKELAESVQSGEVAPEPVMKAEPDPHHIPEEPGVGEERPEVKLARAVERSAGGGKSARPPVEAGTLTPVLAPEPVVRPGHEDGKTPPRPVPPQEGPPREGPPRQGPSRKPERVGKSGAPADGEDLG